MSALRSQTIAWVSMATALVASPAAAQEREVSQACVSAYERTGELRAVFKDAVRARAEAQKCASICPLELADECKQWATEEQAKISQLEIATSVPLSRLSIRLDGDKQTALTLELNAGKHELSASAPGFEPLSLSFELKEGEARRLDLPLRPVPAPPRPPPAPEPEPPIAGYTLLSVGLAGLAAGGALGIVGHVRASDLRDSCAPFCTDDEVGVVEREWIAGGVSAGVGLAALTTGVVLLLLPGPPKPEMTAAIGGNGGGGTLRWHF